MKLIEISVRADLPRHIDPGDAALMAVVDKIENDPQLDVLVQSVTERVKHLIPAEWDAVVMDNR